MRVEIPDLVGVAYIVKFIHIQEGGTTVSKLGNKIKTPLVRHTECKILQATEGEEKLGFISIGYSRCHPNDNFEKETGRQLSLKKALEDGSFTKEVRSIFWDKYRNWGKERF